MHIGARIPITFRGAPAALHVIRNDGYCWGKVTTAGGEQFDVGSDDDLYDEPDEVAEAILEDNAARDEHVGPAVTVIEGLE